MPQVQVTLAPDVTRLTAGAGALTGGFTVSDQSDHVGLRLTGPPVGLDDRTEIRSRGVPIGAVEVTPSGDVIILLRGRLVTAGYPVVAVVTTVSLDLLAQVRPGQEIRLDVVEMAGARTALVALAASRAALARRVATALTARGLGHALHTELGHEPGAADPGSTP